MKSIRSLDYKCANWSRRRHHPHRRHTRRTYSWTNLQNPTSPALASTSIQTLSIRGGCRLGAVRYDFGQRQRTVFATLTTARTALMFTVVTIPTK